MTQKKLLTKRCSVCKKILPLSSFYKRHDFNVPRSECIPCSLGQRRRLAHSPDGIHKALIASAKKRGIPLTISQEDFYTWYRGQRQQCIYCGFTYQESKNLNFPYTSRTYRLSIDRKDNKKGYEKGNLCLACSFCNSLKGAFFSEEDMKIIGNLIRRIGKKDFNNERSQDMKGALTLLAQHLSDYDAQLNEKCPFCHAIHTSNIEIKATSFNIYLNAGCGECHSSGKSTFLDFTDEIDEAKIQKILRNIVSEWNNVKT